MALQPSKSNKDAIATMVTFTERTGNFHPLNGIDVDTFSHPSFADIDSDGDLDVFLGRDTNATSSILFFENTGDANFPNFVRRSTSDNLFGGLNFPNTAPSFADLDGDADLDSFIGERGGQLRFFQNIGNPTIASFANIVGAADPADRYESGDRQYSTPAFGDIDGDGDLDALVGSQSGGIYTLRNEGNPSDAFFTELPPESNPLGFVNLGGESDGFSTPEIGDLDKDGDLDVIAGDASGGMHFFQNIGTSTQPNFVEAVGANNPFNGFNAGSRSVPALADIDADSDLDLFVGTADGNIRFFENTSPGALPAPPTFGGEGDDTLVGTTGQDAIVGLDGNDSIGGAFGDDSLFGNVGNDTLLGNEGNDFIAGGRGADFLAGGSGDDVLNGNLGPDAIFGESGNDVLDGGDDDDQLFGGAGNDVLAGGWGTDTLTGGVGNDLYILQGGEFDIMNFVDGEDTIGLPENVPFEEVRFFQGRDEFVRDNLPEVQLWFRGELQAILPNLQVEQLNASDFVSV